MRRRTTMGALAALAAAMLMAGACIEFNHVTAPSESGTILQSLSAGLWSSTGGINPDACGNFKWSITELNTNTAKGTFSATCAGGITLTGTAEGTLNGSVLNWTAAGTAATAVGNCPFTIAGTATLEGTGVRVNYTAITCVGTFSGSELLKK